MRDRAGDGAEVLVLAALGGITFATSASHVLDVGQKNGVTGWHAWSVAGTVEIIAAYAGLEVKRRHGWRRVLPLVVFAGSAGFLLAANLASAASLTVWGRVYAVVPPVAFLAVMLIAETKRWPGRTPKAVPLAGLTGDPSGDAGGDLPVDGRVDRPGDPSGDRRGDTAGDRPVDGPGDGGGTTADRILAALAAGAMTPKELADAGCGSPATIKTQLGKLRDARQIVAAPKEGRGKWKLAKKLAVVS